ncbi:MAG: hypothetical protein NTV52_30080 [Acidobacteria bacterium]|nr:hypothetical protein [Acidobacteriota bacterium]
MASKKQPLHQLLSNPAPSRIDPRQFADLAAQLAPIATSYLRHLLRDSGVPLDALVEGVRQDSFDHLARTLSALSDSYPTAPHQARALVLEAKAHAKLALRRDPAPAARQLKIDWMIRWLENPPIFPLWVSLQKRVTETPPAAP